MDFQKKIGGGCVCVWGELYPNLCVWIFGICLTLQSPLALWFANHSNENGCKVYLLSLMIVPMKGNGRLSRPIDNRFMPHNLGGHLFVL